MSASFSQYDLTIDPSLILIPKYTEIAETVEQNYRTIHFNVPRSFYDVLEEYDRFSEDEKLPPQIRFFNSYVDMPSLAEVNARFQQLDVGQLVGQGRRTLAWFAGYRRRWEML